MQLRLTFLLWLVCSGLFAQSNAKYSYSLGAEVSKGIIYRHHENMGHLIKGMPEALELSWVQHTHGAKNWEALYGYPDVYYKLSYYDLKNDDVLGRIIALSTGMAFHLLGSPETNNRLQLYFGMGVAYSTKPYNKETNNLNNAIGSALTYNGNLKLSYHHAFGKRWQAGVGFKITHFSNGAVKLPNLGLNLVSLNASATYRIIPAKELQPPAEQVFINRKLRYGAIFRMGWAESSPAGSGVKPVYALTLLVQKQVAVMSLIEAGLEGFANKAVAYEIKNSFDNTVAPDTDYRRVGLMVGHELLVNKLALVTQLGLYVYRPYYPNERIYTRLGLSYYFTDALVAGFSLKTHFAVAEVIEYSIGYRF